jgi:ABC-type lipoprotein export system ATPase subunit
LIEAVGLSKTYNKGMPNEVRAVEGANLKIGEGRIIALTGPSGCGKTTILSMLGLILTPTYGEITIDGERVLSNSDNWKTSFRRGNFGFIFQHINLLYRNTAMENVMLPLYSFDIEPRTYAARAQELFERLGLKDRAGRLVETLSGGEQQRVAFVRALIKDPKYIFADEPTVFVDEETSKVIYDIFSSLRDAGKTVIMSTHDSELLKIADDVHRMSFGRISD